MANRNQIIITEKSDLFQRLLKKNLRTLYDENKDGYKDFEMYYKYKSHYLINAYKNGE